MARNEEKQLARLNRFYLQKDKEAQLKKNPPRPRLETLNTSAEIQKWLPSIKRDLNFYIKQSEVTCYTQSKIDEFSRKINALKWEYRGFVRKLRELNPGLEVTPWTDRPYAGHKRKAESQTTDVHKRPDGVDDNCRRYDVETSISKPTGIPICNTLDNVPLLEEHSESINTCTTNSYTTTDNNLLINDHISNPADRDIDPDIQADVEAEAVNVFIFTPLSTPLLEQDSCYSQMYGYSKPAPVILNANKQLEGLPLEFCHSKNTTPQENSELTHIGIEPFTTGATSAGTGEHISGRTDIPVSGRTYKPVSDRTGEPINSRTDESFNSVRTGHINIALQGDCLEKAEEKYSTSNPVLINKVPDVQGQCLQHYSSIQDQPLQFSNKSRTCQNLHTNHTNPPKLCNESFACSSSNHGNMTDPSSDRHTNQCSFKTNTSERTSHLNLTHQERDETCVSPHTNKSELDRNCLKASSTLVVPYSDSESETDTCT